MRHSAAISALDEGVALAVMQDRPGDCGTREAMGRIPEPIYPGAQVA
jgi:hypothetical protein